MLHAKPMFLSFTLMLVSCSAAFAQHAKATTECVAPALSTGATTPDTMESTIAATAEEAAPTPIPAGVPADQATIDRFIAAEENLNACLNAGEYDAAAALFSPHGLEVFFSSPDPADAAANLAGYPPLALQTIETVEVLPDGRIRGEITYTVGAQLAGDVEYWVEQNGVLLLDDFAELPEPLQAPDGSPIVALEMIDYAIVLSDYTVPTAEAIVFRTSIRSATDQDHVATLIGCPEGTAVEQIITGEIDYTTACPFAYGQQYLRPGQEEADMILMGLEPGTYFLVCDVPTPSGHSHHALGMVAQVTVE